jgi:tetratricopeptide (TPR) repeat protein
MEGDLAEAEAAFAELSNVRLAHNTWMFRIPQALFALERQGTLAEAAGWDLGALMSRTSELPAEAACLARIVLELGRQDLARNVLDRMACGDFSRIPKDISYLNALVNLSLVAIALRDRARAEALYARLSPYPHHNTPSALMHYEGSVSHYLALLAEFLGATERVRGHFDAALTMNKSLGHKVQLARTYYEYARFLCGDRARPDQRARQMKAQAQRLAGSLGMSTLEAQANAL